MAYVFRLSRSNPELAPTFLYMAIGGIGFVAMGIRQIQSHDVIIDSHRNPDPWNSISQGQNTKFYTRRPEWWAERAAQNIEHPQASFREEKRGLGKEVQLSRALDSKKKVMARREVEQRRVSLLPSVADVVALDWTSVLTGMLTPDFAFRSTSTKPSSAAKEADLSNILKAKRRAADKRAVASAVAAANLAA